MVDYGAGLTAADAGRVRSNAVITSKDATNNWAANPSSDSSDVKRRSTPELRIQSAYWEKQVFIMFIKW